jgi:hydrogenase-4 component F
MPEIKIEVFLLGTVFMPLLAVLPFLIVTPPKSEAELKANLSKPYWPKIILGFHSGYITSFFSLCSLISSVALAITYQSRTNPVPIKANLLFIFDLYLDDLSLFFILVVNLVAFFASACTIQKYKNPKLNEDYRRVSFHVVFNLFHFTMQVVLVVDNLMILWIAVQLTTVASTFLVRQRGDRASAEAAWKFLIITTTGIIFAFLGTILLASANKPGTSLDLNWSTLANRDVAKNLETNLVITSFMLILIGYGTKAGLAPMHTWLPDGHGEAPAPVSAMLSGVMLKTALYAILRFFTITKLNLGDNDFILGLLIFFGLLSLIVATPLILKRHRKFKRVLAYHSLEHMGIITFGIGIGSPVAVFGALLHVLNHAVTKALMFLVYGFIQDKYSNTETKYPDDEHIRGVWGKMPVVGTVLAGGGLALVGSPPFNIFMSEFIILWAAIQKANSGGNEWFIVAIIIYLLTLALIFGGLIGHLSRLLFDPSPNEEPLRIEAARISNAISYLSFGAMLFLIFLFGLTVPNLPVDLPALLKESARIILEGPK